MAANQDRMKDVLDTCEMIIQPNIDSDTVTKVYDDWATTYDEDLEIIGDNRKKIVCDIANELFKQNKEVKILDAGSGTGNIGQVLYDHGFKNMDALDASSQMLEVAKRKNIYKRTICDYLGPKRLDIDDDTYDSIMCIGALLPTHINEEAFDEMIRITKPGGYVIFQIAIQSLGEAKTRFDDSMQKLHDQGKWEWMINRTVSNAFDQFSHSEQGLIYVFRILPKLT